MEFNTVRIGDNLPINSGASQCFIGGILSHPVPQGAGNSIVTIDPVTQQLGVTTDFSAAKVQEQQKKIEEQQASINQLKSEMQTISTTPVGAWARSQLLIPEAERSNRRHSPKDYAVWEIHAAMNQNAQVIPELRCDPP